MMTLTHEWVTYPLHYRAEKLFGQELWKVTLTMKDQVFTIASTDKELFRKLSDLKRFESIQIGLDNAFRELFKPEIINYLNK
jgi:hypothetical protein